MADKKVLVTAENIESKILLIRGALREGGAEGSGYPSASPLRG